MVQNKPGQSIFHFEEEFFLRAIDRRDPSPHEMLRATAGASCRKGKTIPNPLEHFRQM
jgi:hypothetical protein